MADELESGLRALGIDTGSLRWLREGPERIAIVTVPGTGAIEAWTRLRAATSRTGRPPLLLGGPDELGLLAESWEAGDEAPIGAILAEAERFPDPVEWAIGQLAALEGDDAGDGADDADAPGLAARLRRFSTTPAPAAPAQYRRNPEQFVIPSGITGTRPLPRVELALLPTAEPWHAPAHLRFGGWNDCPGPATHAGLFRTWMDRYGAEPVGITRDVIEARVLRPPQSLDRAERLALVQYAYAPDLVDQGVEGVDALAEALLEAGSWCFWWD